MNAVTTVPAGHAVQRALRFSRHITPGDARKRLATLQPVVQRIRSDKESLLPIEYSAAGLIDQSFDRVMDEYLTMKAIANSNLSYDIFDPEPLTWRNAQGFPQLVPFNIYHQEFELSVTYRWDAQNLARHMVPNLPFELAKFYDDVFDRLAERAKRNHATQTLHTRFEGMLPDETKAKIAQADGKLSFIHVVAEVPRWDLREIAIPDPGDPLVIGYDGACWRLVDAFDLTELEQTVRDRYTIPVRE